MFDLVQFAAGGGDALAAEGHRPFRGEADGSP
jgi:hypothetical protein